LHPDCSDALDMLCARRPNVVAYAAGHTHRHRVRPMTRSGVPSIEVGCTKDFPGTWAEYRVYDGGVMQVVHRMSSPEALAWSESCRSLYSDFGVDYASYALGTLADRCFVIDPR
jgi:Icc protein